MLYCWSIQHWLSWDKYRCFIVSHRIKMLVGLDPGKWLRLSFFSWLPGFGGNLARCSLFDIADIISRPYIYNIFATDALVFEAVVTTAKTYIRILYKNVNSSPKTTNMLTGLAYLLFRFVTSWNIIMKCHFVLVKYFVWMHIFRLLFV